MSDHILIIGANTQVGRELLKLDWPSELEIVAPSASELSLFDHGRLSAAVKHGRRGVPWLAIINCAEYDSDDRTEGDVLVSWLINAVVPAVLGEACNASGVPLVHFISNNLKLVIKPSSECLTVRLDAEMDSVISKFGGELAIRDSGARHVTLKADGVFSDHHNSFLDRLVKAILSFRTVEIPERLVGKINSATAVAQALAYIALDLASNSRLTEGTFEVFSANNVTWFELIDEVVGEIQSQTGLATKIDNPEGFAYVKSVSQLTPAIRDATEQFDFPVPTWRFCVRHPIKHLI